MIVVAVVIVGALAFVYWLGWSDGRFHERMNEHIRALDRIIEKTKRGKP